MALRLMILVSFIVVLANGCGKGRTTKATPCPTTTKPSPRPTTTKPSPCPTIINPPGTKKHVDVFVYEHFLTEITFLADHDTGLGMIFIECGASNPYQSAWFTLQPDISDPASIHVVPESGPGRKAHDAWLAGARAACPLSTYDQDDLESFVVDENGNAYAGFLLRRRWLPYVPGLFKTGSGNSQEVGMNIRVLEDGSCHMALSCSYKVTATDTHTLDDLVTNLKENCSNLPEEYYAVTKWNTVRFASPDAIFVTGNYITDRAYRTS
ncbi:hypothetical protein FOZ63_007604 [Perkinsus olseni]|uniref:Uncharacterized protein n=1 Tax=Perkinsus olseni TaxID=32597 RepID=A0A7J6N9Z9_PEROL|nr:hypothetical protein FOZ60_013153 [Perkinsus olseni]KAF4699548.1 hypothetical protein FOZ63_007604 [Perkinsus olseni]